MATELQGPRLKDLPRDTVVITGYAQVSGFGGTEATTNGLNAGETSVREFHEGVREISVAAPVVFNSADHPVLADRELKRLSTLGEIVVGLSVEASVMAGVLDSDFRLMSHFDADQFGVSIGYGLGQANNVARISEMIDAKGKTTPTEGLRMLPEQPHAMFEARTGFKGHGMSSWEACATGLSAVIEGYRLLKDGTDDFVLAGGFDLLLQYPKFSLGTFHAFRALSRSIDPETASKPFSQTREGFVMGEGGGVVAMERLDSAIARDATVYAIVRKGVKGSDGFDDTSMDSRRIGRLVSKVTEGEGVDVIFAHATGTPAGDIAEARGYAFGFEGMEKTDPTLITSIKSGVGHAIGGAGALTAVAAIRSLHEGLIPPTRVNDVDPQITELNLEVVTKPIHSNPQRALAGAFGFGGNDALVVFEKAI